MPAPVIVDVTRLNQHVKQTHVRELSTHFMMYDTKCCRMEASGEIDMAESPRRTQHPTSWHCSQVIVSGFKDNNKDTEFDLFGAQVVDQANLAHIVLNSLDLSQVSLPYDTKNITTLSSNSPTGSAVMRVISLRVMCLDICLAHQNDLYLSFNRSYLDLFAK